jgi:hypothetical protein
MHAQWRDAYRYGAICVLALALLLFAIAAPQGAASRTVVLVLAGAMLVVAAVTSGRQPAERRGAAVAAALVLVAGAVLSGVKVVSPAVTSTLAGVFATATVVAIAGGLGRLLRDRGVTAQAVAGGLAIYVLVGLVFAFAVDLGARVGDSAFFASGTDGTLSEHVYYSFTVMTTTGLGDFAPATSGGRAIASAEMLFGQIYLVTVVALLISNLRRKAR